MEKIKNNGKSEYNNKKKSLNYNNLSKSIDDIKVNLQKAINDYSKEYLIKDPSLKRTKDPFNKGVENAKELKEKVGEVASEVGEGVLKGIKKAKEKVVEVASEVGEGVLKGIKKGKEKVVEVVSKVKEKVYGKKPNEKTYGVEINNIPSQKLKTN
jgi:hypothetical protein